MDTTRNGEATRPDGEGVTIREAAGALGVTVKAVRARIRRGTLRADMVPGRYGDEYRVYLGVPAVSPIDGVGEGVGQGTPGTGWKAERAALMEQIAWLRAQIEADKAAAAEHRRLLLMAQQTIAAQQSTIQALPAPKARRPWWKFGRT